MTEKPQDPRDGRKWVRAIYPERSATEFEEICPGIYVNHAPAGRRSPARFFDSRFNYEPCDPPPKSSLLRWIITGRPWKISQ